LHNIGRTVGGFYAVSTLGSVIGTALTGFVLIAYLGVDAIFQLVGFLLILLAASYFALLRRLWWPALLLLIPALLVTSGKNALPTVITENGTRVSLVATHNSHYGNLKVVDYRYRGKGTREMMIDGLIQGGIDINSGESVYAYPYFLQFLPYALHDNIDNSLVIGLGAGIVPRWFERQSISTDVVDIDPAVFEFARDYFSVTVSGEEILQDARYFLQNTSKSYDVVVLDVFNGDTTPGHLLSIEALKLVRQRLAEGGILAINLVGSLRKETYMTASVDKTLQAIFDNVEIHPTFDPANSDGTGNLIIIAYQGAARKPDFPRLSKFHISPFARDAVHNNLGRRFKFPENTTAIILTDDYNPLDFFDSNLKEKVRKDILKTTEWPILMYSG